MKNWTLRFRAVDKKNFDELKRGDKSIETRASTIKYQPIEVGDMLTFVCGKERCVKIIIKKYHWPSIDAMAREIDFKEINPSAHSLDEVKKMYASYPNYDEKIKKNGLLGFVLSNRV